MVEPRFLRRDVRDVGRIRAPAGLGRHVPLNEADRQAQRAVDRAHPLRVATRQVVVEGQDVHAAAVERPEGHRQRGRQRLALAGLHLHDAAVGHGQAGHDLLVVQLLADRPAGGLAHEAEDEGQPFASPPGPACAGRGSAASRSSVRAAQSRGRAAHGRLAAASNRRQVVVHRLAAHSREAFTPSNRVANHAVSFRSETRRACPYVQENGTAWRLLEEDEEWGTARRARRGRRRRRQGCGDDLRGHIGPAEIG